MDSPEVLIEFDQIDWEPVCKGLLQKQVIRNDKRLRLMKFIQGFTEQEWCSKGHIGYVLEGRCEINFNGSLKSFESGQAFFIESGDECKHKLVIGKIESVVLFVVEEL